MAQVFDFSVFTLEPRAASSTDCYVAEASEIGLRPGSFPREFKMDCRVGNGQPFEFRGFAYDEAVALYRQLFGCVTAEILND